VWVRGDEWWREEKWVVDSRNETFDTGRKESGWSRVEVLRRVYGWDGGGLWFAKIGLFALERKA
jgi:hypothetical protein